MTAAATAWSLGGLFTRVIQSDNATMLAWRGIFGAIGLSVALLVLRRRDEVRALKTMGWLGWVLTLQAAAGMTFYLLALRHTSVANVAVIYATAPFLAAALGWLVMRERPSISSLIASTCALAGVAVMVGFGSPGGFMGDLLALGMTWSMASISVVAKSHRQIPLIATSCIASLMSGLACWPFGAPLAASWHELGLLAAFGLVNFAVALPLFTYGARLLPAIETALIGAVEAPLAPFWVWLAFNEVPGASTVVGGAIVFAAVAVHLIVGEAKAIRARAADERARIHHPASRPPWRTR